MPLAPPIDAIQQPAVGIYGLPVGASAGAMVLLTASQIRAISGAGTSSFDGAYGSLSGVPSTFAPSSHAHGNITNAGAIGSTTDLPIITTASGVLTAGSFGTTAGTFAAGNDSRITGALSEATAATTYLPLVGGTLTGDLLFTDATYDIGKSGATRPRDIFASRVITSRADLSQGATDEMHFSLKSNGTYGIGSWYNIIQMYRAGTSVFRWDNGYSGSGNNFGIVGSLTIGAYSAGDVVLTRDAAGILAQRNGTNAQTLRVAGTWTSSTSYETFNIKGKAAANFEIGPENGSAGGTLRGLTIGCYPAGTATIVGWAQFRPNASTGALGAFYLGPIADSTAVGGNARGTNAVDLQISRTVAAQVASGANSFVAGTGNIASGSASVTIGNGNTVSNIGCVAFGGNNSVSGNANSFAAGYSNQVSGGEGAIALGNQNIVSGNHGACAIGYGNTASDRGAFAGGQNAKAVLPGQRAHACGFFAAVGDAQYVRDVLQIKTTNATPTTLKIHALFGDVFRTIPSGKILFADILVSGIKSDGSASACYKRKVAIKNVGGTTSLVGTVETIGTDIEDNASTDVAITADNTNDALQINVTGIAAETWRWVAVVECLEIAYGT